MYFNSFPRAYFEIFNSEFPDFTRNIATTAQILENSGYSYILEQIESDERPDTLSTRLYGSPEYYWTFFVVNDHLRKGLCDWPLSNHEQSKVLELVDQYSAFITYPDTDFWSFEKPSSAPSIDVLDYDSTLNLFITDKCTINNDDVISANGIIRKVLVSYSSVRDAPTKLVDYSGRVKSIWDILLNPDNFPQGQATKASIARSMIASHSISFHESLETSNREKSYLKVVKPELIVDFSKQFRNLLNK